MNPLKMVILGLAAARLTQLVVDDEITQPIRAKVYEARKRTGDFADQVDTMINCHACSSVWAGAGVLTAEHTGPVGRFLVRTLALSQAALAVKSVIERIDR